MNYDEYDAGAQAVDWQESHDEAAACAQMEQDQAHAQQAIVALTKPVPF